MPSMRRALANRIKCSEVMVELKCLFRAQTSRLFAGERFNDVFTDQPQGLSPEQVRQLRQRLDKQRAQPKKPMALYVRQGRQARKPAQASKKPLTHIKEVHRKMIGAASSPACRAHRSTSTTTTRKISRSSSRASRCRKPSSVSRAEVAPAYFVDSSALVERDGLPALMVDSPPGR